MSSSVSISSSPLPVPEPWQGVFISAEPEADRTQSYGTLLRKEFSVSGPVKEAYLIASAHGLYHAYLNGQPVSPDELAPGWTSYQHRLLYQTYEVTRLLRQGENAIGAALGPGWYKGTIGYKHHRNLYGTRTAFGGHILIRYEDGREERVCTDGSWRGSRSSILFSEIYDGETRDARLDQPGWNYPGFDDSRWLPVEPVEQDLSHLFPQTHPPVRIINRLKPARLFRTPKGDQVLDFGQNLTGWCETVLEHTHPGDCLELQFFEVLDADGNVYTDNLRGAKQTIRYLCRGGAREVVRPWFTFQGFQYAKIVSFPGEINPEAFTACVVHSALKETGSFQCSSPLVNQLWHNIVWGMKSNFVDVPTDCPQRDERLGWTGDIQVFGPTAAFLMDISSFSAKWLADLAADQDRDGSVPHVVPDILTGHMDEDWLLNNDFQGGASGWGDVAVFLPWTLYQTYGDREILRRQMPSMRSWLSYLDSHSEGCLFHGPDQFGDWLGLDAEPGSYKGATPDDYTCAAFYCHVTRLVSRMLRILGEKDDADALAQKADALREDFRARFFAADGTLTVRTQTAHVLALAFDLVPEGAVQKTAAGLKALLREANGHLTTGFLGTPWLPLVLSKYVGLEDAYELVLNEDYPGWLYPIRHGATTMWEHWDGIRPDGSMWSPDMNSFNHYAYGSVGLWLVQAVAGLEPDEAHPGYEHFRIRPGIGGGLTWAELRFESVHGPIHIRWDVEEDVVTLRAEIPDGTSADVVLSQAREILEPNGLSFEDNQARADAGTYVIRYRI